MGKPRDLDAIVGKKIGRLKVVRLLKRFESGTFHTPNADYLCICDCGTICVKNYRNIMQSPEANCGCLLKEVKAKQKDEYRSRLIGKTFGMLKVAEYISDKTNPNYGMYRCECECGNTEYYVTPSALQQKKIQHSDRPENCGCLTNYYSVKTKTDRGIYLNGVASRNNRSRLYRIHAGMITRCYNENAEGYHNYGGRGIRICDEWYTPGVMGNPGYINFSNWAYENGYADNLTIDRKDPNGPYAPWNCQWVTMKAQSNNLRRNRIFEYNGTIYTLMELSELLNVSRNTIMYYVKHNLSLNAMIYNLEHPDNPVHYSQYREMFVDEDGFVRMIPNYHIKHLGRRDEYQARS